MNPSIGEKDNFPFVLHLHSQKSVSLLTLMNTIDIQWDKLHFRYRRRSACCTFCFIRPTIVKSHTSSHEKQNTFSHCCKLRIRKGSPDKLHSFCFSLSQVLLFLFKGKVANVQARICLMNSSRLRRAIFVAKQGRTSLQSGKMLIS